MTYRSDLWEVAAYNHGVLTLADAEWMNVPAVEVRKLAARGVLERAGHGVYIHKDVAPTKFTQPAAAVALGGKNAFLQLESVFNVLEMGNFSHVWIDVATFDRVRRKIPHHMRLKRRVDLIEDDIVQYEGIRCVKVSKTLEDLRYRMSLERWTKLREDSYRYDLISYIEYDYLMENVSA